MGMYTEILIKCSVKEEIPDNVRGVLDFLFNGCDQPRKLPGHEFFTLDRWQQIGSMSSHYHIPWSNRKYEEDYIFSRSDLKNYSGEIESFFDWLDPYIREVSGQCVGYSWYEEDKAPTLIFKK